jgi:SAM-dependent methyltransferase
MKGAPDFNRLARLYRWMEFFSFGPFLALTRGTFVDRLRDRRKALVLGDGDGRFTARLLRTNAAVRVDAVDGSGAMLAALMSRTGPDAHRVSTQREDIRAWSASDPDPGSDLDSNLGSELGTDPGSGAGSKQAYDLIATHFFLDCLTEDEIGALAGRARRAAAPGALWVVSEFRVPSGWFGLLIARPIVAALYLSFGILTGLTVRALPDYAPALQETGFRLLERRLRLNGLLVAELWDLHLKTAVDADWGPSSALL